METAEEEETPEEGFQQCLEEIFGAKVRSFNDDLMGQMRSLWLSGWRWYPLPKKATRVPSPKPSPKEMLRLQKEERQQKTLDELQRIANILIACEVKAALAAAARLEARILAGEKLPKATYYLEEHSTWVVPPGVEAAYSALDRIAPLCRSTEISHGLYAGAKAVKEAYPDFDFRYDHWPDFSISCFAG
jgi:hypothetical protein